MIVLFSTLLFSKSCCFSGIVLRLIALIKASTGGGAVPQAVGR
jgi:hypothetical protein